ncbi:MAG: methionyl-tRNA formyltransferase [Armatimonadetes bacterium]|nr:methionyl-tRNA formyltransferase [Armatimonadota bacterium]NIM23774.1 methionyl-tRNA formyltransferase [Armatimonadota bacterium]NIM67651.1 methionyl-tRNA formyltransferase [Armatimonadota bacterium]NIM76167.1 methionyl-tRNA formyltransferase [Armatimonadota bacterium]NIN05852.1 methionyl-tRNA formyltransferase [Armatimonadota bacterium]
MKIVFMGTSAFAVPSLRGLVESRHEVAAVFTRPDKPAGRGRRLRASPVKEAAVELGLPVFQPERIADAEGRRALEEATPDLCVVAAYGEILPRAILEIPRLGCMNIHASLLPKYRGADPIRRAIMAGEMQTGVTIMWMSEGLDEGDVIMQQTLQIGPEEDYGSLHDRLAVVGAQALLESLEALERREAPRTPQDDSSATFAPPLKAEEKKILWEASAEEIHNLVRALNPAPGAYCLWKGKRLKVWKVEKTFSAKGIPGTIVEIGPLGAIIASGQGGVRLLELQPEGRNHISGTEFVRGYRPVVGELIE